MLCTKHLEFGFRVESSLKPRCQNLITRYHEEIFFKACDPQCATILLLWKCFRKRFLVQQSHLGFPPDLPCFGILSIPFDIEPSPSRQVVCKNFCAPLSDLSIFDLPILIRKKMISSHATFGASVSLYGLDVNVCIIVHLDGPVYIWLLH